MRANKAIAVIGALGTAAILMAAAGLETATLKDVTQINQDGFGGRANKYAFSMAVYRDSLYVGTLNIKGMPGMFRFFSATTAKRASEGAEIWRYDSSGAWKRVVDAGLGNPHNIGVRKMFVARDCLYGVTANHDEGMEVWRTCDGDEWEAVVKGGFGDRGNTSGRGLGFFKGHIYAGTENRGDGAQLWRSADGQSWEKVAERGIDDKGNVWVSDFAEFQGRLYMGTLNILGGMQAFRTADGESFERIFKGGLEKRTNTAGMKLIVFKDRLFLSSMDFFRGFDLYVSDDGENFERVLAKGYTSRHHAYLWQMEVYNGRLYAGTYRHSDFTIPTGSFSLFSSEDGIEWTMENDDAFGNPWYYGVRSMAVYDGRLVIGTASARYGCKVFTAAGK